ncbi:hypothetical protein BDW68DRAFT_196833 [Aspergillus falconensis]
MAFRSRLLTLLAAVLLFLGACAARSIPTRRSTVSLSSTDHVLNSVEIWTHRVHDSGSDSSSSSNSDVNSDDEYVIHLHPFWGYRCFGHLLTASSENSTVDGTTPDGSGIAPRFDNSMGAFVTLVDDDAANAVDIEDQRYLSYVGGAAIPFKSGNDSPNGVSPEKLDSLPFATVDEDNEYQSRYSLGSAGNVPVYCFCDPYGLCGCDDHHGNSSFVDAMLAYVGLEDEAKNVSKICTVSLDGATTTL